MGCSLVEMMDVSSELLRMVPQKRFISFDSKWVDCVASSKEFFACSSGKAAYVWTKGREEPIKLEHPSTIGGLAFDAKGRRFAVAHYGGVNNMGKA